jgi:ribosomal protein S20
MGSAIAVTPTIREARTTHAAGTVAPSRPATTRPIEKLAEAASERRTVRTAFGSRSRSLERSIAASTTPTAMTVSTIAVGTLMDSPSAIEMSAAAAPSVAMIGATIDTRPIVSAAYANSSPRLYVTPTTTSPAICGMSSGIAVTRAAGPIEATSPTVITHEITENGPIIRLERDDESVAIAQDRAAPRPPTIAITGSECDRRDLLPSPLALGARSAPARAHSTAREGFDLARTPRKWTGARSPSGLKRVRSAERREAVLGPRRSAAKTAVRTALSIATAPAEGEDPQVSLAEAMSALDRAAKTGAIHPNAAARRKSRLAIKVNALAGGTGAAAAARLKTVSRTAAQKAARARIAAGKADKAKGAQTAAGKARAALSRTSRAEAAEAASAAKRASAATTTKAAPKASAKAAPKAAAKKAAPKASATAKPAARKAAPKKAAKS